MSDILSSMRCWAILTVFILGTVIFMVYFYNKTVDEISHNFAVTNQQLSEYAKE